MPGKKRVTPRKQKPEPIYLAEWRERQGDVSQAELARRLGVTPTTVHRWERVKAEINGPVRAAIAEALGIRNPNDLNRHPDRPSIDELLDGQPQEVWDEMIKIAKAIRK